jgi:hypothetical protein
VFFLLVAAVVVVDSFFLCPLKKKKKKSGNLFLMMMMDIIHVHVRLPVVRTSFRFQPTGPLLLHFSPTQSISTFRPRRKRFL